MGCTENNGEYEKVSMCPSLAEGVGFLLYMHGIRIAIQYCCHGYDIIL